MIKHTLYGLLFMVAFSSQALGLDLKLKTCQAVPTNITDIKFIISHYALITTQPGGIYFFRGCDKPLTKIATIDVAQSSWELGLYSIAVSPDFVLDPVMYLYYATESDGELSTRLSAFKFDLSKISIANINELDLLSEERILLEIDQPYTNGTGGALRFGPDGLLYLGVGDGGSEGDPQGNGQNIHTIHGSIVRIKPDLDTAAGYTIPDGNLQDFIEGAQPEILAYGLRNPWKFTFDSSGNLIIGDVGEHDIEEVDLISSDMIGTQALNLGWNIKEGTTCFNPPQNCDSEGLIDPIYQYEHNDSGNSITGGETMHLSGKEFYVFGDYMTGQLSVLDLDNPSVPVIEKSYPANWTTFAKDLYGKVYAADYSGGVLYQIKLQSE